MAKSKEIKRESCPICNYNGWREIWVNKLLNPNGEYVKGYGSAPFQTYSHSEYWCISCGYKEGASTVIIEPFPDK